VDLDLDAADRPARRDEPVRDRRVAVIRRAEHAEVRTANAGCQNWQPTASLDQKTRLALPWNTLLAGFVWIIQIVSPWGGST